MKKIANTVKQIISRPPMTPPKIGPVLFCCAAWTGADVDAATADVDVLSMPEVTMLVQRCSLR
jgi:hypothetical protein